MAKQVASLSEDWLDGFPDRLDIVEPVMLAQKVLVDCTEDCCRRAWTDIQQAVNEYRQDLFLKDKPPRADTWRGYNTDALTPGQPLFNPSDLLGLLFDGIADEHSSLRPVMDEYGVKVVLAITVLAIAADLPGDNSHDLEYADWMGAAVVSCWRCGFYLQYAVHAEAMGQAKEEIERTLRSEIGIAAARKRHAARDKVYAEAMRLYSTMDPALPMAEAARRIQREIAPFAEKEGYRTTHENPWATIYKWIRAQRKNSQKK